MNSNNKIIYLAGPLFTQAEQEFNLKIYNDLLGEGYQIFLPQKECKGLSSANEIFNKCLNGLNKAEIILAILDGPDADSGTCFEIGYAYANEIPVIGLRTDFRGSGDDGGLNLMLTKSCKKIIVTSYQPIKGENIINLKPGDDYFVDVKKELSKYTK